MDLQQFHLNRILLHYAFMKLSKKIENLRMEDLNEFFNEEGWAIDSLEKMSANFRNWIIAKELNKSSPVLS